MITGELVRKQTKRGENRHVYYRCSRYQTDGHPRVREADLDEQILDVFSSIRIDDDKLRDWFAMVLQSQTHAAQESPKNQRTEIQRQLSNTLEHQDRLINMRMADEIDAETFAKNNPSYVIEKPNSNCDSMCLTVRITKRPTW